MKGELFIMASKDDWSGAGKDAEACRRAVERFRFLHPEWESPFRGGRDVHELALYFTIPGEKYCHRVPVPSRLNMEESVFNELEKFQVERLSSSGR